MLNVKALKRFWSIYNLFRANIPFLKCEPVNLLHENHEESMDDAEETIIDLRSVSLEIFDNPL